MSLECGIKAHILLCFANFVFLNTLNIILFIYFGLSEVVLYQKFLSLCVF